MKDFNRVFDYMELYKKAPLGASKYAPLIIMVNEDKKILDNLDANNTKNFWGFLDYAIDHTFKEYDVKTALIDHIIFVLELFKTLDNKDTINIDQFIKLIMEAK